MYFWYCILALYIIGPIYSADKCIGLMYRLSGLTLTSLGEFMHLQWTTWLTLAVLCMSIWNVMTVGRLRNVHQVKAPAMDGPPEFLRAVRVQTNTVEQMIIFLPALWLCAVWTSDMVAALLGAVWLIGRIMYALAYLKDASKRSMGFLISSLAVVALMLGVVAGLSGVLK